VKRPPRRNARGRRVDLVLEEDAEHVVAGVVRHGTGEVVGTVGFEPVMVIVHSIHQPADGGAAFELKIEAERGEIHIVPTAGTAAGDAELLLPGGLKGDREARGVDEAVEILPARRTYERLRSWSNKAHAVATDGGAFKRNSRGGRMRAPHIILAHLLMHGGEGPLIIQRYIQPHIEGPLVVAGVGLVPVRRPSHRRTG
jgi:hypothetical protein